jgi:hypothetical protein
VFDDPLSHLPFNALAPNPLQDVWRAIAYFDLLVLAIAQETNRVKINEVNLGQVQNHAGGSIPDP